MATADLLLQEFDEEAQKTRKSLERVPSDNRKFAPHPRSMPLERLAPLVAQLPEFGVIVLTTPALDFGQGTFTPLKFESAEQLVSRLHRRSRNRSRPTASRAAKNKRERMG